MAKVTLGAMLAAVAGTDPGRRSPWMWNVIEPTAHSQSRASTCVHCQKLHEA